MHGDLWSLYSLLLYSRRRRCLACVSIKIPLLSIDPTILRYLAYYSQLVNGAHQKAEFANLQKKFANRKKKLHDQEGVPIRETNFIFAKKLFAKLFANNSRTPTQVGSASHYHNTFSISILYLYPRRSYARNRIEWTSIFIQGANRVLNVSLAVKVREEHLIGTIQF